MTLKGLGNDIIEIDRVRNGYKVHGQSFLDRLFTKKEIAFCQEHQDPFPRYAGRFAAKEAIVKALGCGFGSEAAWHDIEILPDAKGKPEVYLSGALKERFNHPKLHVTISHCKSYATAVAILEN